MFKSLGWPAFAFPSLLSPRERPVNRTGQTTLHFKLPQAKFPFQVMRPNLFQFSASLHPLTAPSTPSHIFYKEPEILQQGVEALWPNRHSWQDCVNHHCFLINMTDSWFHVRHRTRKDLWKCTSFQQSLHILTCKFEYSLWCNCCESIKAEPGHPMCPGAQLSFSKSIDGILQLKSVKNLYTIKHSMKES